MTTTGPSTWTELLPEPTEATPPDLRGEFIAAYGKRAFVALAAIGSLFLLPFSLNNFAHGHVVVAVAAALVGACLVANAWSSAKGRKPLVPTGFTFLPVMVALGFSMHQQGLIGILWCYAAVLLFHFALPRAMANVFNGIIVAMAVPMAWLHLGPAITARVAVTLGLTLLFTNIFSFIAEARQRKEVEQRQRLDLILRGTNAGTLEWEAGGRLRYSRRLRQILGRGTYEDDSRWDFFAFVHPLDRERVKAQLDAQFLAKSKRHSVMHQPPDEYRLLRADGETVWVHTEAIFVSASRTRARRCIVSFMDISERLRAQQALLASHEQVQHQAMQLEEQNARLREAVRIREEVERIARHDLKAPLASIASIPRLLRQERTPQEREELLTMIERAALRVLSMVNLSLDLHRMEQGTYRLRPRAVELAALARTVAHELVAHAESKAVFIHVDAPPQPVYAYGEELLCYSILANLVKNAVEAAPDGAAVRIAVHADVSPGLHDAVLSIHNPGAVPRAVRSQFFEKYATSGKPGGTGLGAYSARLMAQMQGGELCMRTDEAEGTTLTLALPLADEAAVAIADATRRSAVAQLASVSADFADASADAEIGRTAEGGMTVLVVDDDMYNILVLRSMLAHPRLKVVEAVNGRAAIDSVRRERPDVIFLDLQMPIMGGLEAAGQIRELQRKGGEAPSVIVAFSARDDEESRLECARAGFDHYLVKPAPREELVAILASATKVRPQQSEPAPAQVTPELAALLPGFVASRRELLQHLQAAADAGSADDVRQLAHKLAGSLGMFGFVESSQRCREIEEGAASMDTAALRNACAAAGERFEQEQRRMLPSAVVA